MIVILSTLNGASRLRDMFEAILGIRIPEGTRFHIVNNGSTDETDSLLHEFATKLPLVLYTQPVRGKNHCLNLVLNKVAKDLDQEELVVFTDDDVLPSADWLEELQAAANAHPECDVFAGRILPHWPKSLTPRIEPLRQYFGVLFSLTSSVEGPCNVAQAWGPNMAVRARIFKSGIRFDPQFGPNGTIGYPMGSETELMERLGRAGYRGWFAERACVRHMIRDAQLDISSIVERAFRHGYGVGWRQQRGNGWGRLALSYWCALRGVVAARIRQLWASKSEQLLHEYREAWARGLASGASFEYRKARRVPTPSELFPHSEEEVSGKTSD